MTLLALDSFDAQDYGMKWVQGVLTSSSNATWATDSASPYGAGLSLKATRGSAGSVVYQLKPITPSAQIIAGFAFATTASAPGHGFFTIYGDLGATQHLAITVSNTGVVSIYRGDVATLLAASAAGAVPLAGAFCFIEISATIDSTVGSCVVRVNGATVVSFTGNTRNGGTSTNIDAVHLTSPDPASATGNAYWFDDFYLLNALGSVNNAFLGITRVQMLLPTGAGSSTQFTPVSGANYANVNDVPDNTASYNSDSVIGHRDTFATADLVAGTDTIYGLQQVTHARALDAGPNKLKNAQKSGASISYGTPVLPGVPVDAITDVFEQNPATAAAWTPADVNALEIGYEVSA